MADHSSDEPTRPPTAMSGPATGVGGTLPNGMRIGGRYTILALIGRGGMGAVYKAWDAELGVPVAMKTIAIGDGTDPGARADLERRFQREAQLARAITHQNIVRIHDLGDIEGMKYLTMSFVDGETLADMIRRVGPLPVKDAMTIARQIVDGMVAAHEAGVVHRDLKPENVMIAGTHAYIMDFGLALSQTTVTNSGAIVGTVEYMAPEQGMNLPVDGRADIYAFGLILYDMLTGRQRLRGRDEPMSELLFRMNNTPAPVRTLRPEVPDTLSALIDKTTQPLADKRFANAVELQAAMSALALDGHTRRDESPTALTPVAPSRKKLWAAALAVAGVAAIAAVVWGGFFSPPPPPAEPPQPLSVIVANFVNRSGDPIFDGLVEQALAVGIESASFINAYPRATAVRAAAQFPDKTLSADTARLIALREGMGAVITGAIEPTAAGYRLPVQVLRPDTSNQVLFDAVVEASGKADILDAVGRLAARVRSGLGDTSVDADQVNVNETFTANSLEAAAAYIEGQNLLAEGNPEAALAAYQKAVDLDPQLGRAWSGMGTVANNLRRRDEAKQYYDRALQNIDRMTERERFRTRGSYYTAMGNAEEAREENEALIKRFPADAAGLSNLALAYFSMWNFPRALEVGRQAAAIYPRNVLRQSNVALYAMYASDFPGATAQAQRVLDLNKDYPRGHLVMALGHMANGQFDQAAERYRTLSSLPAPGKDFAVHGLAEIARYRGRLEEAASHFTGSLASVGTPAARARLTAALASVRIAQGRGPEAIKLVSGIRLEGLDPPGLTAIGEVFAAGGRLKEASAIASTLSSRVGSDARAFGAVLQSQVAIMSGNAAEARRLLVETRQQADAWLVRYWLGRAYLAMNMFKEAEDEFEMCLRRRGEAVSVFLDDFPTYYRWLDVHYYHGLARDGLKSPSAADSFKTFLAPKEGGDETGGPVADARKRVAGR